MLMAYLLLLLLLLEPVGCGERENQQKLSEVWAEKNFSIFRDGLDSAKRRRLPVAAVTGCFRLSSTNHRCLFYFPRTWHYFPTLAAAAAPLLFYFLLLKCNFLKLRWDWRRLNRRIIFYQISVELFISLLHMADDFSTNVTVFKMLVDFTNDKSLKCFFKWAKPSLFLFYFRSFHMTNIAQIL